MPSNTAVLFGKPSSPVTLSRPLSPQAWTCVGALAIPLWATWPALALRTLEMPAFECLTIAFLCGWLVLSSTERGPGTDKHESESGQASWLTWLPPLACALGLTGSNAFHILATHFIPAAEANLISYLWPVMIVALGAMLGLFRLMPRQLLGLALGFVGVVILLGRGALSLSFIGIDLALLSGLSWALYCIYRLKWNSVTGSVLGRGCALSTILCGALHLMAERTVVPSIGAVAAAAAVGIVPLAFGNLVWDEGFRRGDSHLLAVMAYATPLCSALLLAVLGLESLTLSLLLGAIVIVVAGFLSTSRFK